MEIRIDTAKDSKEDIRKAIRLLQSLADESSEAQSQGFPTGENVLGGFFEAADTASQTQTGTTQNSIMSEKPADKTETKSRKFSIGSSGGFDVY